MEHDCRMYVVNSFTKDNRDFVSKMGVSSYAKKKYAGDIIESKIAIQR